MTCDQCCGTADGLSDSEYGWLCDRCAWRQYEADEARETYAHLSPSMFGFDANEPWDD